MNKLTFIKNLLPTLLVAGFFYSCKEVKKIDFEPYVGPVVISDTIEGTFTDSANVQFFLKTPQQVRFQSEDEEFPNGLYLEFFNNKHQKETTLKARYGYYTKKENKWFVKDSVVLINLLENRKLETEELYWKPAEQRVYNDKFVRITTDDQLLTGTGLEAKDDFSDYEIKNPEMIKYIGEED